MNQLRWGIIGCGDVVEKKSGPSIRAGTRSYITAAMRRDQAKLTAFADEYQVPLRTADPSAVIDCSDVDIVYVATPPSTHRKYAIAAVEAGKHVLVEKPMSLSAADSQVMIGACKAAGVELFVAYYRRFQPHVLKMRELDKEGALGQLVHGQVEYALPYRAGHDWGWRTQPALSGGGLFADILSHRIDLMVSFFGEPLSISGVKQTVHGDSPTEDLATALVQFASGAQCTFIGNFSSDKHIDRFVLTGTQGEIKTEQLDGHAFTLERNGETEAFALTPYPAPHTGLVRHIEDVLAGNVENGTSGVQGRLTDWVLDNALRV